MRAQVEGVERNALARQLPEPAFDDGAPYRVVGEKLRHDADAADAARAVTARGARQALARGPGAHQPRAQPTVTLQKIAVVLLLVGEEERLHGADGFEAAGDAARVVPAVQ